MTYLSEYVCVGQPIIGLNETISTVYSLAVGDSPQEEFRITPEGRVVRDGVDVTNDDKAMAECLVILLKIGYKIEVKR